MEGVKLAWSDNDEGGVVERIGAAARDTVREGSETIVVCTSDRTATERASELARELEGIAPWVLVAVVPPELDEGGWRKSELFASPVYFMDHEGAREVGALEDVLA